MGGKESDVDSENTIHKTIDSNNKLFLQKYFNFSHGGDTIIQGEYFWGIRVPDYLSNNEKALELVEIIMNSNHFNGVVDKTVCYVVWLCFFVILIVFDFDLILILCVFCGMCVV